MSDEQTNGRGAFVRACLLFWAIGVCLVGMYYLPERIGDWELKPVDLLGRLRVDSLSSLGEGASRDLMTTRRQSLTDSLSGQGLTAEVIEVRRRDSIYNSLKETYSRGEATRAQADTGSGVEPQDVEGSASLVAEVSAGELVPIQDFSPRHDGLKHFFDVLRSRGSLRRPVRIAVLGDSFIEGDIFTAPLRKELQQRYGGAGVGWMPMSSEIAGFRTSVRHRSSGWSEQTMISHQKASHLMTGRRFVPEARAWTEYATVKGDRPFAEATIYYTSPGEVALKVTSDDSVRSTLTLPASAPDEMGRLSLEAMQRRKLRLEIEGGSGAVLYGVSMEGTGGVTLDNMSLRGSSGLQLSGVADALSRSWAYARPYDLIVVEYGLNVANDKQKDYSQWRKRMKGIIERIRGYYPEASILLLGVSDRGRRTSSGVETMPSVRSFHRAQEELASELGVAFWSLYSAVRSLGGIAEMANRGCAAKDYTHMTSKGGVELSRKLIQALDLEQQYYDAIAE